MDNKADIGLIGLAVMGENLVLNMESHGFSAAVYNRTTEKVDNFVNGRGKGKKFIGCHSLEELCASLKSPRKIMMMVKAGKPVDDVFTVNFPIGVGVKYKVANRLNVGCEMSFRFSMSDKLDVTSKDAPTLDDPLGIKSDGMKNKDSYSFFSFFLTYDIMPKYRKCNN